MPIQVDTTALQCSFCRNLGLEIPLVRSMHGLYCQNENCYSRIVNGNLAPAAPCENCHENAFYFEPDGRMEDAAYQCIACGHIQPVDS